ncbi:MAG: hypothetical protein AAGE65_05190 [Planctomycetota bacterium]
MPPTRNLWLLASGCLLLAGCGPRNFTNDNDRLRRENLELTRQVEALEKRLNQRLGQIETLHARLGNPDHPAGAERPMPSGLSIDNYSGPIDTDRDGLDDVVRLYLLPTDQQGRMLPVSGTLTAALVHLPDTGEPTVLRSQTLDPTALDEAYRDGFTGPYYHVELDLGDLTLPGPPTNEVIVRVVLEPMGGGTLRDQRRYRIRLALPEA